jgi:hypothetical protein
MGGELSLQQWRQPREDNLISDLILVKVLSKADFERFQSEFEQPMTLVDWESITEVRYESADVKLSTMDNDNIVQTQITYTEIYGYKKKAPNTALLQTSPRCVTNLRFVLSFPSLRRGEGIEG